MVIYISGDHRGFAHKNDIKNYLVASGYEVVDCGPQELVADDDYPDFAKEVGRSVSMNPENGRGIVICASGVGASIVANKFDGVRCGLCLSPDHAIAAKEDDDANVLAIAADFMNAETAKKAISAWLQASFKSDPRYLRRVQKIRDIEVARNMEK
jgi:ribose 5-phosphate isomerase B